MTRSYDTEPGCSLVGVSAPQPDSSRVLVLVISVSIFLVAGCSLVTQSGSSDNADEEPATATPEEAESPTPELTTVLVKDSARGVGTLPDEFQMGDTIRVALGRTRGGGLRVGAYGPDDDFIRNVRTQALGPVGGGEMVVNASKLNVRSCPEVGCGVVDQLEKGELVRVKDFVEGWYQLAANSDTLDGEASQYSYAAYLILPKAYRAQLLAQVQAVTNEFARRLSEVREPGYGNVFTNHDVSLDNGVLHFDFYTPYRQGRPMYAVCDGMEIIADFVESTMEDFSNKWFRGYSAGVYYTSPRIPYPVPDHRRDDFEVASLGNDGAVYCTQP